MLASRDLGSKERANQEPRAEQFDIFRSVVAGHSRRQADQDRMRGFPREMS